MTQYHTLCRRNVESDVKRFNFSLPKGLLICLVSVMVVGALAAYLFAVNSIASQGFQMHDLDKQISELKAGKEKLTLQMVQLKSMTDLNTRITALGLVDAGSIAYFKDGGEIVAKR